MKIPTKTLNSIASSPKTEVYMQLQQPAQQYVPVQFYQRPSYVPQPQPAMIIIAQPAVVPQHMLLSSAAQQLLSYFQSNPQAKYQFLYGGSPQGIVAAPQPVVATPQSVIAQGVVAAPTYSNYQFLPAPQYQQQAVADVPAHYALPASPVAVQPHPATQQPYQLSQIAHLAQMTAQQISSGQIRSAPAIITGLENFTPEQQAQIKAQIGTHIGNAVSGGSLQEQAQTPVKYSQQSSSMADFVPSQQIKSEMQSSVNYNSSPGDIYKTGAYSKG